MPSLHILVVEDDPSTNRTLVGLLEKRGHVVTRATSIGSALHVGKVKLFDLAIVDVGLPDGDGWTLVAELKRLIPGLRAIALTGYGYDDDKKRSKRAGCDGHLTKPIQISTLEREIARICTDAG